MKIAGASSDGCSTAGSPGNSPRLRRYVWLAIGLLIAGLTILSFDIEIAQAVRGDFLPGDLQAFVSLSEVFAHGAGVAVILILIGTIAVDKRRQLVRVAACAVVPGLFVTLIKTIVVRDRPSSLTELPANVSETFHGFLPALAGNDGGLMFDRAMQSFPSGHSATAVGLAIGLSWLFPRGRWCFAVLAMLAMCQRIDSGAHFPSDTLIAAALAAVIAGRYITGSRESRWFDKWESKSVAVSLDSHDDTDQTATKSSRAA